MYPTHYIFNHFQKTGGISLASLCRATLGVDAVSPLLLEDDIRIAPERFEHFRLIAGHFHVFTQARFAHDRFSMTILREPIARIVSGYNFWRKSPEHNFLLTAAKEMSFTDYVHYFIDSPLIDNNYSHFFAMIGRDCPGYPPDAAGRLAAAKRNLAAFDFVGITEEFDRSVHLLCRELGWPTPASIPHENSSDSEAVLANIDPPTLKILQDRNQLDSELYRYGVRLFHERGKNRSTGLAVAIRRTVEQRTFVPFHLPSNPSRRAVIQSVCARWEPDDSERTLDISVDFTTTAWLPELSLDIQVHDASGALVWKVNTTENLLNLNSEKAGSYRATFRLECALPANVYLVTVGLFDPRRFGFHEHWIDRATLFEVARSPENAPLQLQGVRLQSFRCIADSSVSL